MAAPVHAITGSIPGCREGRTETDKGVVDMILHSRKAKPESVAYLLVGQVLHIAEEKDLPAPRRQSGYGSIKNRADITAIQGPEYFAAVHIITGIVFPDFPGNTVTVIEGGKVVPYYTYCSIVCAPEQETAYAATPLKTPEEALCGLARA